MSLAWEPSPFLDLDGYIFNGLREKECKKELHSSPLPPLPPPPKFEKEENDIPHISRA